MASSAHAPRPLNSLMASAQRITSDSASQKVNTVSAKQGWQEEAWTLFDMVGELRFLVTTLANRMGQARLYVGKLAEDPTEDPEVVEDNEIANALASFGGSGSGQTQLVTRLGLNLLVPGEGYLAGVPTKLINKDAPQTPGAEVRLDEMTWFALSLAEVNRQQFDDNEITLTLPDGRKLQTTIEETLLIRVWRPHPRYAHLADSAVRASLPVLRKIVGLGLHSEAQVDSRLAGAGLMIVPSSAQDALRVSAGIGDYDPDEAEPDYFTEALLKAMTTPIKDRGNASAVVPLVVTSPDEAADKFRHISFAQPLDASAPGQMDQALRRLALGVDAPPELLLGTSGMNHWGGWLVQEDVVQTHLAPPLALICDALTVSFLWPVLEQSGVADHEQYVVWFDVSDLTVRPTRAADAALAHERGVITDASLRNALGFDDNDAPKIDQGPQMPPEVELALTLVQKAPTLLASPGLPELVAQIREALAGDIPDSKVGQTEEPPEPPANVPAEDPAPNGTDDGAPPTAPAQDGPPAMAAAATRPIAIGALAAAAGDIWDDPKWGVEVTGLEINDPTPTLVLTLPEIAE